MVYMPTEKKFDTGEARQAQLNQAFNRLQIVSPASAT